MIEIPESIVIASQLNALVRGKRIAAVETEHTKHSFAWYAGDPQAYDGLMTGKTIGTAWGIGSMVEIELEDYCFVAGDGTNIRYYKEECEIPARYQTRITLEDGSSLICTVQMYGAMNLIRPQVYDNIYYQVAKTKPMPGTSGFTFDYFQSLREQTNGTLSIKAFLATEQRIPGLGNGTLQDILLSAGLHPKHKISTLLESDWKRIYQTVVSTLHQMTEAGGRDTERDLFGKAGGYPTRLSKKTVGRPCPYCGTLIQKTAYLGGTVYYCSECQS